MIYGKKLVRLLSYRISRFMIIFRTHKTWEYYFHFLIRLNTPNPINTMPPNDSMKAIGPHNGSKTHHQDQVITLVSFSVIKTIVNKPRKEIPPVFTSLLICFCFDFLFILNISCYHNLGFSKLSPFIDNLLFRIFLEALSFKIPTRTSP